MCDVADGGAFGACVGGCAGGCVVGAVLGVCADASALGGVSSRDSNKLVDGAGRTRGAPDTADNGRASAADMPRADPVAWLDVYASFFDKWLDKCNLASDGYAVRVGGVGEPGGDAPSSSYVSASKSSRFVSSGLDDLVDVENPVELVDFLI